MQIFVTELNICDQEALALFAALPPAQARRNGDLAATVAFHLVRYALRQSGFDAAFDDWQTHAQGKPYLSDAPHFNLTHSRYGAAVVVCDKAVGIDLEQIRPHPQRFAERYFSQAEQAMLASATDPQSELIRIWTAKEAEAKRLGTGLAAGIAQIPINNVTSIPLTLCGKPHWLSVAPAIVTPSVTLVPADLLK